MVWVDRDMGRLVKGMASVDLDKRYPPVLLVRAEQ